MTIAALRRELVQVWNEIEKLPQGINR